MSLQQQLQDVQDDQRVKQLDLREEALNKREALLNESERLARLEIINKQIAEKERTKVILDQKNEELKQAVTDANESYKLELKKLNAQIGQKREEIGKLTNTEQTFYTKIENVKKQLNSIREEVHDQELYLKEQQEKTDQTINEWNNQLKEFQAEELQVREEKDQLNKDVLRLQQRKMDSEEELEVIDSKNVELDALYKEKVEKYKAELKDLNAEVQTKKQALLELDLKNEAHLKVIATKEKSLTLREQVLQKKEFEYISKEKQLNMKLGLSQMSIE